jgi:predicted nucleic acid-binding protein
VDDHPPIGRLLKATVFFDTTVPRHFGVINECTVLRNAFPRALITTGVELELTNARGPVAKLGGDLGPLLDDPCWAGVEELVDAQILDVEQLRLGLGANRPEDLLLKETKDLGEFETVVASQAKGGFPIVMEDGTGARAAAGRGLACYQTIHVCLVIAIRGLRSPEESWALYGRLLDAGLKPRNQGRVSFTPATREEYLDIAYAALEQLRRKKGR